MHYSGFIDPDQELESLDDPAEKLGIVVKSGYRAVRDAGNLLGQNRIFDNIVANLQNLELTYEDQCSAQYYFDLVRTLRDMNGEYDRVAEVGVFMGGASTFLAACVESFDYDLDLIDIKATNLRFAYERIRRVCPSSTSRIRLFHGDLPHYVRHVILKEPDHRYIVHHDASHRFDQTVKDMASLYYIRDSLHAVIAQDTHLRGAIGYMNFVDMALYAVFGIDLNYAPIGKVYNSGDSNTIPNEFQGNYFVPNAPEGFVLPMAINNFSYPHPNLKVEDFLPPGVADLHSSDES